MVEITRQRAGVTVIPGRYPYTYAADYMRQSGQLSRADASTLRKQIARALGMPDHDLAVKLAERYLDDREIEASIRPPEADPDANPEDYVRAAAAWLRSQAGMVYVGQVDPYAHAAEMLATGKFLEELK